MVIGINNACDAYLIGYLRGMNRGSEVVLSLVKPLSYFSYLQYISGCDMLKRSHFIPFHLL